MKTCFVLCTAKENFQEYPFPGKVGGKTGRGRGCAQGDLFILTTFAVRGPLTAMETLIAAAITDYL